MSDVLIPTSEIRRYRCKVFIPGSWIAERKEESTLEDLIMQAVEDLNIEYLSLERCFNKDGWFIYLAHPYLCCYLGDCEETPIRQLMLSASEGWKLV